MTELEKPSQKDDSTNSREVPPESRNLTTRADLFQRLKRSHDARIKLVDSHINKTLAFQIRSLRGDMSQEKAMEKLGMNQNAISRLENPYYGKATLTTLKRIAAAYDVGLLVEFVPFSRLVDHVSGTPSTDLGLSPLTMNVPTFDDELAEGSFEEEQPTAELSGQSVIDETPETIAVMSSVGAPPASGAILQNLPETPTGKYGSDFQYRHAPRVVIRQKLDQTRRPSSRRRGNFNPLPRKKTGRRG